jgi:ribosomal-protein-alanine N-acetyltransferase
MTDMNSTTFRILKTERLTLRQLSIDEKMDIFALRSDPGVNKYLNRQPCQSVEDAIIFINKVNDNIEKNGNYYWANTLTDAKTLLGSNWVDFIGIQFCRFMD